MSRRQYPTAELYEERERDFYRSGPRSSAGYDELDIDITRARTADPYTRRGPDFLRDDYGRTSAGPLVVRDEPHGPRRAREIEKEELIVRDRPAPPRERVREETDVIIKREERSGSRPAPPRSVRRSPSPSSRSSRTEIERDEFTIRRAETQPAERPRRREYERDEILFRRGDGDRPSRQRPREVEREDIVFRHEEREERTRERSLPPPRERELVAREHEELIVRRRRASPSPSPSPPPPPRERSRERVTEEIVIRRTERSPTPPPREPTPPPPAPEPKPEPALEPITRPPIYQQIHQEIITHHRHIDHGVIRARSPTPPPPREPTPPPPPPPRVKEENLEIEIRRRGRGGIEKEDIIFEREIRESSSKSAAPPPPPSASEVIEETQIAIRQRSVTPPARRRSVYRDDDDDIEAEADYYNRKALERGYYGEAYNRSTKDWGLVDIPPGTQRVRMDGAGGGEQEITWQSYNGSRRAKFKASGREYISDYDAPARRRSLPPPESRKRDMWTEVTKDLVIRDAVQAMGYQYEETDEFFYVMEYLRYEDVVQLVELSDDIRRDRKKRIREIEREREKIEREEIIFTRERERERKPKYDERVFEREVIYDTRRGRH